MNKSEAARTFGVSLSSVKRYAKAACRRALALAGEGSGQETPTR